MSKITIMESGGAISPSAIISATEHGVNHTQVILDWDNFYRLERENWLNIMPGDHGMVDFTFNHLSVRIDQRLADNEFQLVSMENDRKVTRNFICLPEN